MGLILFATFPTEFDDDCRFDWLYSPMYLFGSTCEPTQNSMFGYSWLLNLNKPQMFLSESGLGLILFN